jgi:hypothetical protein
MDFKFFLVRRLFKYFSPFITFLERPWVKKYAKGKIKHQPIFILGVPRSGSTILYQLITSCFDVSYINNLAVASRENLYAGLRLSNIFYKNKRHDSFDSDYGNTFKSGLNAPAEGGSIWYKWFSKEKIYFEKNSLSQKQLKEIKELIVAITNRYNKPLVIKNLMFSQRLEVLHQLFPEAKFIYIKREPEFNAQSIYQAREKNGSINEWWSTKPQKFNDLVKLNPIDQVVKQVYLIEKQIESGLKLFNKNNVVVITYEKMVEDCETVLLEVGELIKLSKINKIPKANLKNENIIKIEDHDFQQISNYVKEVKFD